MKKLITSLTILIVLSVIAITYNINQPQATVQLQQSTGQITTTKQETQSQPITESYIITEVVQHNNKDTEYYGQSTTGDTGIYFTSDYINLIDSLEEGDIITAHFENEYDDSLLYVQKGDNKH